MSMFFKKIIGFFEEMISEIFETIKNDVKEERSTSTPVSYKRIIRFGFISAIISSVFLFFQSERLMDFINSSKTIAQENEYWYFGIFCFCIIFYFFLLGASLAYFISKRGSALAKANLLKIFLIKIITTFVIFLLIGLLLAFLENRIISFGPQSSLKEIFFGAIIILIVFYILLEKIFKYPNQKLFTNEPIKILKSTAMVLGLCCGFSAISSFDNMPALEEGLKENMKFYLFSGSLALSTGIVSLLMIIGVFLLGPAIILVMFLYKILKIIFAWALANNKKEGHCE